MVRFGASLTALLFAVLDEVSSFGIVKQPTSFRASVSKTELFAEPILMPALSSTMKEGKIVTWLKDEGDEIEAGEAIMVVESDKADMDVEAFEDGFLAKIIVAEGEMAPVGEAFALIASSEGEIDADAAAAAGSAASPAEEAAAPSGGESVESTEIFMPALSSTMSEGKVVEWIKKVGDFVEAGEALMVVESDKADMDVEAFEDGYLAAILTEEGGMADVGAPVGILGTSRGWLGVLDTGLRPPAGTASPYVFPDPYFQLHTSTPCP